MSLGLYEGCGCAECQRAQQLLRLHERREKPERETLRKEYEKLVNKLDEKRKARHD